MLTELALTLLKFWVRDDWTKARNMTDNRNVNFCFICLILLSEMQQVLTEFPETDKFVLSVRIELDVQ